jgi:uncharacterized protein YdhG (YjbR/CyaY superfamily)
MTKITTKSSAVKKVKLTTADEYLRSLPTDVRKALEHVRSTIKTIVPDATEKISYGMPTFFLDRALVGYAAFKNHCSLFPWSRTTIKNFAVELSQYETSAGTIRFPASKPLPAPLLKKILLARIEENALRNEKRDRLRTSRTKTIGLPEGLAAPARRALSHAGIRNLPDLAKISETELAKLHGIGPNAIQQLRRAMKSARLSFADEQLR